MLTNIEVLELIQTNQAGRDRPRDGKSRRPEFNQRDYVEREIVNLLSGPLANVNSATMAQYLKAVKATNMAFNQQDLIQFANIIPKSEVEIHVAFGDGRFTEDQIQQLIDLSNIALKPSS